MPSKENMTKAWVSSCQDIKIGRHACKIDNSPIISLPLRRAIAAHDKGSDVQIAARMTTHPIVIFVRPPQNGLPTTYSRMSLRNQGSRKAR